jgi:hypothetical protein
MPIVSSLSLLIHAYVLLASTISSVSAHLLLTNGFQILTAAAVRLIAVLILFWLSLGLVFG